ncbi:MAG: chemotaxis response regulator protein-glutamate methylesterase [Nitrospirae bacterium]|nr:chemotaxis response regulator protein-glutamate methylesterase [Nitrospirota bacterium]NTW65842.1 chemotaxis response regulator protein-glutamate methylesterase [Nitrospirota bacterium]
MTVKVLIVDDSAFMRNALTSMLSSDPEIKVIGTARDGMEAVEKVALLKPDVVTMDVEMPRLDGLAALRLIMEQHPVPVIMVSSLTAEGAKETLDALDAGAVDFIPKNLSELSINIVKIKELLLDKVKQIAKKGVALRKRKPAGAATVHYALPATRSTGERRVGILAIGSSTGGPRALQEIIPLLPKEFPVPIVISQHMPQNFTGPFAERLNQLSRVAVKEAAAGDQLKPGLALIAPGGWHMRIERKRSLETVVTLGESRDDLIYRPSVDELMLSVSECFPGRALGVILTGMGNDGVRGMTALKKSGGRIFAQNEESCVVYGMPKAVVDAGIADKVLAIEEMAGEIINAV